MPGNVHVPVNTIIEKIKFFLKKLPLFCSRSCENPPKKLLKRWFVQDHVKTLSNKLKIHRFVQDPVKTKTVKKKNKAVQDPVKTS